MSAPLATRYVAPSDLAPDALLRIWRSLPVEKQETIGTLALLSVMADTVMDDDGLIANDAERTSAAGPAQEGAQNLWDAVQGALPDVLWYYPEGYLYEARNRHGALLGTVEWVGGDRHRFRSAAPCLRLSRAVDGDPIKALPKWASKAVEAGGTFSVVLPDGRRYPGEFSALDAGRSCDVAQP